jgi:transcription initiation factor TFIIIB Brf1 subunit/transcription initiation factor TFIIB
MAATEVTLRIQGPPFKTAAITEVSNRGPRGNMETCQHEGISPEGVCMECGMTVTQLSDGRYFFTTSHTAPRSNEKSLKGDLDRLNLPADVKAQAETIYKQLQTPTHRNCKRRQMVLNCVERAYLELRLPHDIHSLAQQIGVAPSDITKSLSQHATQNQIVQVTPHVYMRTYMEALRFDAMMQTAALAKLDDILLKDPEIQEQFPKKVAAGVLLHFMQCHGLQVAKSDFARIAGITEQTINSVAKRVHSVDNGTC